MSTPSGEVRRFELCDVFISHIHQEAPLAEALKRVLQGCLPGSKVWVSSEDIAAGDQWGKELDDAMEAAELILVLCSTHSIRAAWVNFEAGAGWGKEVKVVPVCHGDLAFAELTSPLNGFQGHQLATADDLRRLVVALEGTPPADLAAAWAAIDKASAAIDYVPRAQRPLPAPSAARGVLVDCSHGQADWPELREGTIFSWPTDGVGALTDLDVEIGTIDAADQVRAADLAAWHGILLPLPWKRRLAAATMEQIVTWVRAGGRLALLGFELGDLHHEANLNELASRFALRFNGDVLAPPDWASSDKRYGVDIALTPTGDHPLFAGVESLTWRNVQTLAREPGTKPLLKTHDRPVVTPTPESVEFSKAGYLTMREPKFELETREALIVVEATPYLTGKGRVVAIGTWELLSHDLDDVGNRRFAANLLRWLKHPVLFQHDEMRSLTDHHEPLVRAAREPAKNGQRALGWVKPIPVGRNDQRGNLDPVWVIVRLTGLPVISLVLKAARGTSQHWRILLRANGISGQSSRRPRFKTRHQLALTLIRRSGLQAIPCRRGCNIGSQWPARRLRGRCGLQPSRRVEHEPIHVIVVLGCVGAHDCGPPGPAHEIELRDTSSPEDEVDCGTDIVYCHIGCDDGRIAGGWLIHFRWTSRSTVATHIH